MVGPHRPVRRSWSAGVCLWSSHGAGPSQPAGLVSVIAYTWAMESSVICLIRKDCINKQRKDKWVNVEEAGRAWGAGSEWRTQLCASV